MNDAELDALLAQPLPDMDAADFSVALMERIAQHEARPARILSWISAGLMVVLIFAACVFGASSFGRVDLGAQNVAIPTTLSFLTFLLCYVVTRSARE
ncbi:MAG TPA: hypothetical protein VMJ73_01935 [Rhizomicrobium sp.]|nr:hypothetical protein [Rhizomicrobium sp.]